MFILIGCDQFVIILIGKKYGNETNEIPLFHIDVIKKAEWKSNHATNQQNMN